MGGGVAAASQPEPVLGGRADVGARPSKTTKYTRRLPLLRYSCPLEPSAPPLCRAFRTAYSQEHFQSLLSVVQKIVKVCNASDPGGWVGGLGG